MFWRILQCLCLVGGIIASVTIFVLAVSMLASRNAPATTTQRLTATSENILTPQTQAPAYYLFRPTDDIHDQLLAIVKGNEAGKTVRLEIRDVANLNTEDITLDVQLNGRYVASLVFYPKTKKLGSYYVDLTDAIKEINPALFTVSIILPSKPGRVVIGSVKLRIME